MTPRDAPQGVELHCAPKDRQAVAAAVGPGSALESSEQLQVAIRMRENNDAAQQLTPSCPQRRQQTAQRATAVPS